MEYFGASNQTTLNYAANAGLGDFKTAYFQKTDGGLVPVTDAQTLEKLRSGEIQAGSARDLAKTGVSYLSSDGSANQGGTAYWENVLNEQATLLGLKPTDNAGSGSTGIYTQQGGETFKTSGGVTEQLVTPQDPNPSPNVGVFDPGWNQPVDNDPTPGFAPGTNPNIRYANNNNVENGYIQVNGAFFQQTPNGLAAVGDQKTLQGLQSGSIPFSTQQNLGSAQITQPTGLNPQAQQTFQQTLGQQQQTQPVGANATTTIPQTSSGSLPYDFSTLASQISGGIQALASGSPVSIQELYGNIYSELGLNNVKAQLETTQKQLQSLDQERADKIADINENPWLTEGVRVSRIRKLEERYDLKRAALASSLELNQSLWEAGVSEARFLAGAAVDQINQNRSFQLDELQTQFNIAESLANQQFRSQQFAFDVDREMARRFESDRLFENDLQQQEFQNEMALRDFELNRQNVLSQISSREFNNTFPTQKPPTQSQFTASGYAQRLQQAVNIFDTVEPRLQQMPKSQLAFQQALPNFLQSDDVQSYEQAKRNFVNAVLRRESGAAISPTEFDSAAKQYFYQPGDSQSVLQQKVANRNLVLQNFIYESGAAFVPTDLTNAPQSQFSPGDIITDGGVMYQVGSDGISLTAIGSAL